MPLRKVPSFTGVQSHEVRHAPVTVAFVHFTYDAALQIPRFVDRAHTVAKETQASIHSFLGDTLRVTWNAGPPKVVQHEAKGVLFLCRLRKDSGDPTVAVCGAVSTGMGSYQMAGGEHQAALLHLEWMARLNALHTVAAGHSAILMCGPTKDVAKYHIMCRCVDIMGTVDVHEALGEHSEAEEEWLYTLEKNDVVDTTAAGIVTAAVEACRCGRFADALEMLSGRGVEHTPIVQRLIRKVTTCHERGEGTEFADVE